MIIKHFTRVRDVKCRHCGHEFRSRVMKPRCSNCKTSIVTDIADLPKEYSKNEMDKLRKEHNELKKEVESFEESYQKDKKGNLKILEHIFNRIKALEAKN